MGVLQEGSMNFLRFTKLFVERIKFLELHEKIFSQKLDNFKNLCYNKYVRLREAQSDENPKTFSIPSTMRAWLELVYTADSKSVAARRASSNLAARTWQGRARRCVAAQPPKISKEVNSKEIVDRRAATRRNRISLLPLFYLDV